MLKLDDLKWYKEFLETGGYDRATKTQRPSLTLALKPGTGSAPHVELTATAVTRLSKEELTRVRPMLRVEGPSPMSVPAVPTALTETSYDRRLSVRPLFSRGNGEAGMAELIAAMRAGDRMQLEINGRALEPAFSLRGFDAIWRQLAPRCGAGAGAR